MNDRIKVPTEAEQESLSRLLAHRVIDGDEMTYEEIAAVGGCSKQNIEQCENRAIRKLKRLSRELKKLREYLR